MRTIQLTKGVRGAGQRPKTLQDLIPDPQLAESYVHREIHGHRDFDILDYVRAEELNPLIEGPSGPGKTMLFRAYAAANGLPFFALNPGSAAEPGQLFGKYLLQNEEMIWMDGPVTSLVRHGNAVLLLDEVNFMPPGVTSTLHALTDDQRQIVLYDHMIEHENTSAGESVAMPEVISAGEGLLVAAAFNEGYRGTEELNEAFCNRFDIAVEWGYSEEVENDLIASATLHSIAKEIRKQTNAGEIETPCSTNRLQMFERMVDDIGLDSAISNFLSMFWGTERTSVRNVINLHYDRLWSDYQRINNKDPNEGFYVSKDEE
jgi:MoxR-like ATPase